MTTKRLSHLLTILAVSWGLALARVPIALATVAGQKDDSKTSKYKDELGGIVYARLKFLNVNLNDEARRDLDDLIASGAVRLVSDGPSDKQLERARGNARELAERIAKKEGGKEVLDEGDMKEVEGSVCPLYPFC